MASEEGVITALPGAAPLVGGLEAGRVQAPSKLAQILSKGRVRATLSILGPAFVASVAYVDPGNFATNFQAGSEHGYLLVWVIIAANLMAMLIQYVTSKLGLYTKKSLPEVCREVFPHHFNAFMWVQSEIIAMATDLAEFTGAAVGLNLVFGIPLFTAGLITGVVSFIVLGLQQRGYKKFEIGIIALLSLVAAGFIADFVIIGNQSYGGIVHGMLPRLGGGDTMILAIGIIGATVMPHVVYLHSALQEDRIKPVDARERHKLLKFNQLDCMIGLSLAGVINLLMLCIAAALFYRHGMTGINDLGPIHAHMATMVGGGAALAFGVALIASGLSSSSVGTYAGQVVMQGFMNWKIPTTLRRLLTMIPSLIVLGLAVNTTDALVYSQVLLSFGIPFAIIPLALFTQRADIMGEGVNRRITSGALWATVVIITGLNFYLLYTTIPGLL